MANDFNRNKVRLPDCSINQSNSYILVLVLFSSWINLFNVKRKWIVLSLAKNLSSRVSDVAFLCFRLQCSEGHLMLNKFFSWPEGEEKTKVSSHHTVFGTGQHYSATVAHKGHTCKLKMLLQIKNSTCKLKIVHAN